MRFKIAFLLVVAVVLVGVVCVAVEGSETEKKEEASKKGNGTEDSGSSSSESIEESLGGKKQNGTDTAGKDKDVKKEEKEDKKEDKKEEKKEDKKEDKKDDKKDDKKEDKKDDKKEDKKEKKHKKKHKMGGKHKHKEHPYWANASIPGKYILYSDPKAKDYHEYLKAMEFSEEVQDKIRNDSSVMVGISKNETIWTLQIMAKNKTINCTYESGKEFSTELYDGRVKNNTIVMNEKKRKFDRVIGMGGFNSTHLVKFHQTGFKITYKVKNVTAVQFYKRVDSPGKKFFQNLGEAFRNFTVGFKSSFGSGNSTAEKDKDKDKEKEKEKEKESSYWNPFRFKFEW